MKIPFTWLRFGAQIPLHTHPTTSGVAAVNKSAFTSESKTRDEFQFKEGANVFTPKDAIELQRPGVGIANDAGDWVLVSYSQFSFEDKTEREMLAVVRLDSNTTRPPILEMSAKKAFWINNRTFGHVVDAEEGGLKINTVTVEVSSGNLRLMEDSVDGTIPTKTASSFRYSSKDGHLVFLDHVYADRNLTAVPDHDKDWETRGNSALVYDATPVRFWDTWMGPKEASLFSVELQVDEQSGRWSMGSDFVNLLGRKHRFSPTEIMSGYAGTWDISAGSIAYIVPEDIPGEAFPRKNNVYIVDVAGTKKPRKLTSDAGGAHGPVVSRDGMKVAWIEMDTAYDASSKTEIIVYDLKTEKSTVLTSEWDRSAETLAFSEDGQFLYFIAGDHARDKAFIIPIADPSVKPTKPLTLTRTGSVSRLQPLPNGRLLLTKSSYSSPNDLFVLRGLEAIEANFDAMSSLKEEQVTHFTESALKGKNLSPGEAFWFKGVNNVDVQGWIVKPPGWKKEQRKKWPIALLIHGGPQSAWSDSWSTRWNPNVFAQQGYFCVLINPTGSTTFGRKFTEDITLDWGGKPFVDLQKGWKYVLKNYPQVDPERAIGAGGSWGGYAINWIQGHPEYEFGFKAVFAHDGVFNTLYDQYSVDVPYFFEKAWGGLPWNETAKEIAINNSPSTFVHKWHIPELIVHGSKDYRLPETEGIAPFHALQQMGIPSRLVVFPDENHWVLGHGNSLKWHYEVFRWFDEYVGEDTS